MKNKIIIYQNKFGAIELKGDLRKKTLWASQAQIMRLFDVERSVVTKHIRNVFKDKELAEDSVCAKFAHTAEDGKKYQVQFYNLDLILSVGYRVNSKKATEFRRWSNRILRQYITQGFSINKKQLVKNYKIFMRAVDDVKKLLPDSGQVKAEDALELIKMFAGTWFSLDAYDKTNFSKKVRSKKQVAITAQELNNVLSQLKIELVRKNEASDLFGQENKQNNVDGIIGNVFQSFSGKDFYPTAEEKAAHLLYFIVKNHPFIDGNKRSGAFAFIWFLQRAKLLDVNRLTPEALTALTLLVAESNPKDKNKMIGLILMLL